ncbi:DNA-binding LacI/PurR family transcriptional regulator [Microbacterium natoriense]|uniref:DNA-binding LacI/PurR family transcriptional regulator n=1 Tax=Microbacterium natoriense TaxID=284570 RepID=A0AAW8F2A3_9MICO|nr:LacI family DNA-binding transcriptional regulator [Microbacterium natoriense]MDQ0649668.1 DNA-binding LacI/PurR family transcriptional regulator [Microbacterium natoriense]
MTTDSAAPVGGPRKPSIYDVADRAGVSHMTVSRVLNGHPNIRASTRDKVMKAIDEMSYTRSSIARALATNRTMRIGAIVDNPGFFGPNSVLRAIEVAARENGYAVSSFSAGEGKDRRVDAGVMELLTQGVDALCVIAPRASSLDLLRQQAIGLPTLVVKEEPDEQMHTASVDQRAGATAAVRHLIDLGHRKILHVAGPPDWFDAKARTEAWRAALEDAGLPVVPPVIGDWSSDSGYVFGQTLDLGDATAVFVANDQMALGLMHGFAERGIRVPDDVSVVGFDDAPDARHYLPPLTTVRQDFTLLGRVVIGELLAAIEGAETEARELIQPELRVRASTAAPRA